MIRKKVAILTGGGDAPGLNAVIYGIVRTCILKYDYDVVGYKFGYRGLYQNDFVPLTLANTSGILHRGGTIIYSSNKDNLFDYIAIEDGKKIKKDVSDVAVANLRKEGVSVLIVLGGDGTLTSARDFARKGVNVIGVPKTIDNDLRATDVTFGFDTAVSIVSEALGRLHTTAESHHRVMIVEVMGRNAGWIALYSGLAGSADIILIPEIEYTIDALVDKIKQRDALGKRFSIIVVSEGAKERGGSVTVGKIVEDSPDQIRLGGIAYKLSAQLEERINDHEIRPVVLGHTQRGGEPTAADRILSVKYGVKAAEMAHNGDYGKMVALQGGDLTSVSLEDVIGDNKFVTLDDEIVGVCRNLGISFGDELDLDIMKK